MSSIKLRDSVSCCAIAVVAAWALWPSTAQAQRKAIGVGIGLGAVGAIINEAAKASNPKPERPSGSGSRRPKGSSDDDDGDRSSKKKKDKEDTAETARLAKQFLANRQELAEAQRAAKAEAERNVETAVSGFIDELAKGHTKLQNRRDSNVRAVKGDINQVTNGQVRAAIEDAYDKASLRDFEKFTGELWTRDRLLVRIVKRAEKDLASHFEGVGAKGPGMDDLKEVFQKAARDVYAKALETSEVIGVSKSFDRFIRTIYEHSDGANDSLWTTGADGKYEQLTSSEINDAWQKDFVEKGPALVADHQGLDRQFLYRFRARRALYECLSSTYPELARGTGTVTTGFVTSAPAPARESRGLVPTASMVVDQESMWQRVRAHVGKACGGPVPTILARAKSGTIAPLSSRDTGLSGGNDRILPAAQRQ